MMLIVVALVSGVDSKAMVCDSAETQIDDKLTNSLKQLHSYTQYELSAER